MPLPNLQSYCFTLSNRCRLEVCSICDYKSSVTRVLNIQPEHIDPDQSARGRGLSGRCVSSLGMALHHF